MTRLALALVLVASNALAQVPESVAKASGENRANLTVAVESLGDTDAGVVARATFRFSIPSDVPPETPLLVQGTWSQNGEVVKRFRQQLVVPVPNVVTSTAVVKPGDVEVDVRLMIPLKEDAPVILGRVTKTVPIVKTNKVFVATDTGGAEEIIAEGVVPEASGAVKIRAPRRDVAPNLFVVDVDVKPPVKRVEFWVEGKKIMARNAPPYRAELDLGKLPKRVEVRAVGYDAQNRYVDADAFIVNERETPLEAKLTRTVTPDGISHFKLSIQNPKNAELKTIALFAGPKKIYEWTEPPYAVNIPSAKLNGIEFVRASVVDATGYEASDLLFMSGDRYMEEIEVNLVELPVTVSDATGNPIAGLTQPNFSVFEDGKPQTIRSFNYASNLPLSVGLLVDHSGSMEKRMAATKEAAAEFFKDIMKPGDRAFVGGFSFDSTQLAPFVTDVASLREQVEGLPEASGGTSLYDAIVTGLYRFRNLQGRKALIVLTDGEDTTSRVTFEDMLTYVRASHLPIYFIGIGMGFSDMAGTAKMRSLAAETGGVAYFIGNVKELKATYTKLENDLRSQYLVSYNTESSKKDTKYRTVEVKVNRPDAKVRTIRGFIP
jgi:Ca-activated chloride channel family protein